MSRFDEKMKLAQPSNAEQFNMAKEKASMKDKVTKEQKREFAKRLADDGEVKQAYAEELIPKIDLNVWADMIASEFCNIGTVSIGEPMWYQLDYEVDPETPIKYLSQHGGTPGETFVTDGETVRIHPYFIQTPEVHMNKLSLRQGDITAESKMRRRAERNMAKRINKDMWTAVKSQLVKDDETLEEKMGIKLDDDIKNFPETNNIDASAEGGLTLDIFKKIADYANRTGRRVRNIYVPSNRIKDIYDWISVASGYQDGDVEASETVPSQIHDQIVRTGQISQLFGYSVNLVALNTLDGTRGNEDGEIELYVSFNEAASEYRDIRELDNTFMEEDASRIYLTITKGVAIFSPSYQARNILRVVFDKFE